MATPGAATDTQSVEDQFLDLIYGDADLLAAEFDAIITAEWRQPPADRPGRGAAGGQPGSHAARGDAEAVGDLDDRPRHPGVGGWARQRSPPYRTPGARHAGKAGDSHA